MSLSAAPPAPVRYADVNVGDALRLRYLEQGPREGDAVLMLHGISDSSFSFSRVLPLLPHSLRVIVPDQRGHGDSDRPRNAYSMDEFALDALELLDTLKVPRVTLVGHSMGSFVARRVAAFAPARIERLVLIGGGPTGNTDTVREAATAIDALSDPVDPEFVRSFQIATSSDQLPPAFFERVVSESLKLPAHVWQSAIHAILQCDPADDPIECDTLVLGGELDAVFSVAEQRALAERIPNARLRLYSGIGHALHWEDPEALARVLC